MFKTSSLRAKRSNPVQRLGSPRRIKPCNDDIFPYPCEQSEGISTTIVQKQAAWKSDALVWIASLRSQ